jgi:hypothetical protein
VNLAPLQYEEEEEDAAVLTLKEAVDRAEVVADVKLKKFQDDAPQGKGKVSFP